MYIYIYIYTQNANDDNNNHTNHNTHNTHNNHDNHNNQYYLYVYDNNNNNNNNRGGAVDLLAARDQTLRFSWPAFASFDPRTELPVEYRLDAWQREGLSGTAAAPAQGRTKGRGGPRQIPHAAEDWDGACCLTVATVASDAAEGRPVECLVDVRRTALAPGAAVYFSVRARYLSLPGRQICI